MATVSGISRDGGDELLLRAEELVRDRDVVQVRMNEPANARIEGLHVGLPPLPGELEIVERRSAPGGHDPTLIEHGDGELLGPRPVAGGEGAGDVGAGVVVQVELRPRPQLLSGRRQDVGGRSTSTVVEPPQPLRTGVENLGGGVGDLHRRQPGPVLIHGHELVDALETGISVARREA